MFSDILYRPFFCARVSLAAFYRCIRPQNSIPRIGNLLEHEFADTWVSQPFILTSPVKQWLIYSHWNMENLVETYSSIRFRAESIDWPLNTYAAYMRDNVDESPLYLFDKSFKQKMALAPNDYEPPKCFGVDLFSVLGEQRPDHAWLIVGPERGGSTFHKDPNSTSAWKYDIPFLT